MKLICYFIAGMLFFSGSSCINGKTNLITIGTYEFNFPVNFSIVEEKGIDSYVGKIVGDSIILHFDYGDYSSELIQTTEEYLAEGLWKMDVEFKFMKPGITYDINNFPKVDVISIRPVSLKDPPGFKDADLIAKCRCRCDSVTIEYPIHIPQEIKQHTVSIDSLQNNFRKLVVAKDSKTGITGIYLRSPGKKALVLYTSNLTKWEQQKIVNIFSNVRIKEK